MSSGAALVTMVRNEDFFLKTWIRYYRRFVPPENMYILVDGHDNSLPEEAQDCQLVFLPHRPPYPGFDEDRWRFLTHFASALNAKYDVVITNDVDELIVLDPDRGADPVAHILSDDRHNVISPFALEIVHRVDLERDIDDSQPILGQRRFARHNASYCKPCITRVPVRWSIGGHYSDFPELHLSDDLFLFHLRFFDQNILLQRQRQRQAAVTQEGGARIADAAGTGWYVEADKMRAFLNSFVTTGLPQVTDFRFEWQRRRIRQSWTWDEKAGFYRHKQLHNRKSYQIPDRFLGLF